MLRAADMVSPAPGCRVGPYPAQIVAFGARAGGGGGWQARAARRGTDSITCGGEKMKKVFIAGLFFRGILLSVVIFIGLRLLSLPFPFFSLSFFLSLTRFLTRSLTHTNSKRTSPRPEEMF